MIRTLPDEHDRASRRAMHDGYAPFELRPAARVYAPSFESRVLSIGFKIFMVMCGAFIVIGAAVDYYVHAIGAVR